jgi:hypothetical protein
MESGFPLPDQVEDKLRGNDRLELYGISVLVKEK